MIYLFWVVAVIAALLLYFKQVYSKFHPYGIKHFRPVPVLGNMTKVLLRLENFTQHVENLYFSFPGERFVARYEFMNPMIILRDVELMKKITVKDFEHFVDHRGLMNDNDGFFSRSLFALRGQEWRDMRSTLSPAFTSSKMKLMVPFMMDVGDQMIKALTRKIEESGLAYIDVDCKDLTTRYANDVIASCAFGLKVDSHTEENNRFYAMGKAASTFNFWQMLIMLGNISFPKLMKVLNLKLVTESSKSFFRDLVLDTMSEREKRNILRPDMIHLLMEAKKGKLTNDNNVKDADAGFATVEESAVGEKTVSRAWSDDDLIAQAVLFFVAGFETVSAAMSFLLYELAMNPDVQNRLVQEIRENDVKNNGKFDFSSIQSMMYMDMVVSELLRLWPPGIFMDRKCTKDYNMGRPNSEAKQDFILRKGSSLGIPAWAIHRDPAYFPDPQKFDPERFSEVNRHKINLFAYMPFGLGPRNCIGSRFALCEIKVMTYQLLQHMEISPCEKTTISRELCSDSVNLKLKGGHWLRMKLRKWE